MRRDGAKVSTFSSLRQNFLCTYLTVCVLHRRNLIRVKAKHVRLQRSEAERQKDPNHPVHFGGPIVKAELLNMLKCDDLFSSLSDGHIVKMIKEELIELKRGGEMESELIDRLIAIYKVS